MAERLTVQVGADSVKARVYAAKGPLLVLAHGAGASQDSSFMVHTAEYLASRGVEVMTFDFVYTAKKKKVPDRLPLLEAAYRAVLVPARARAGDRALFIGGKSMGGRVASHVATTERGIRGLVFLGYPLHPPHKPRPGVWGGSAKRKRSAEPQHEAEAPPRAQHLRNVTCPMLFVQGTRDAFGTPKEIRPLLPSLARGSEVHPMEGADHSFAVSKKSGLDPSDVEVAAYEAVVRWVKEHE